MTLHPRSDLFVGPMACKSEAAPRSPAEVSVDNTGSLRHPFGLHMQFFRARISYGIPFAKNSDR